MIRTLLFSLAAIFILTAGSTSAQDPIPVSGDYTWSDVTPDPNNQPSLSSTNVSVSATCSPGQNNPGLKKITVSASINN